MIRTSDPSSTMAAAPATRSDGEGSAPMPLRRRHDDPGGPLPTVARWPLDVDAGYARAVPRDSWASLVRASIEDYRQGNADRARDFWAPDIVWRVDGQGPLSGERVGADRIFAYHAELLRRSNGTFRQHLLALLSSGGPLVEAHLRTTAERGHRRLDIPTMLVFELRGGRLQALTEIPGDQAAWDAFWAD